MSGLGRILHVAAGMCADAEVPDDDGLRDDLLDSCGFVMYEVAGLADRIRAAKINGEPRPVPTKPFRPQPKPQPRQDPKPPPAKPGDGK